MTFSLRVGGEGMHQNRKIKREEKMLPFEIKQKQNKREKNRKRESGYH